MRVMQDMELDDEEKMDALTPIAMPSRPEYPYGLRICLCTEELKKLNLDPAEAAVGGIVHLAALACITSVSCNKTDRGDEYRIELQIEKMAIEGEDEESRPRASLYGKSD